MLAGAISLLPAAANIVGPDAAPGDFGEEAPPVRPTVTPLPRPGQVIPAPLLLPDSSAQNSAEPATPSDAGSTLRPARTGAAPTRIVIPAINLDAPVEVTGWHTVNGVSQWDVPDHFAAGWLKTSALLGQPGNTVLTGHHNIAGEVFRYLVKLKPGDEIEMYANGQLFLYKVTTRRILAERDQPEAVRLENAKWMEPTQDERVTLITCWPYTSNTHRVIIVAKPFDPEHGNARGQIQ